MQNISQKIKEVISEFQQERLPALIKRELEIPFNLNKVFVIYGLRRAGKTYYLYQLMQEFLAKNRSKQELFYLNFEDERLAGIKAQDLSKIVELYYQFNPQAKTPMFFFDEIQEVESWEKFVRRLAEKSRAKIFITGSSSKVLSKEIATNLRGRTLSYELLPFSFSEFLKAKNISLESVTEKQRGSIKRALVEYLNFGGYPEIVKFAPREKIKTLQEYLDLLVYRDLVERYNLKKLSLLRLLIKALAESFGKEFSLLKYYNFLKSQNQQVSKNTLYFYFEALEEINFLFVLKRYSPKLRVVEGSLPKIYLTDIGYLKILGKEDLGRRLENIVALELLRQQAYQDSLLRIFYYKTIDHKEVDFVLEKQGKVKQLIQVCADIANFTTKERELKSLLKASQELKCNNLLVITEDDEAEEKMNNKIIKFMPLWKWLLNYDSSATSNEVVSKPRFVAKLSNFERGEAGRRSRI